MAIVRCDSYGLDRTRTKRNYVKKVKPLGYPNTSAVCGRLTCKNAGLVWLEKDEFSEYQQGERIFRIPSFATKVRVE
jgi:hypothetical protein